jgi:hypothetical protein
MEQPVGDDMSTFFPFLSLIKHIGNAIARHYDRQLTLIAESKSTDMEQALRQTQVRLGEKVPNRRVGDPR